MRVGTPPVIQIAALEAALDIWDMVDIADVRARAIELSELFISEVEARCPELTLASPRDPAQRGSQVSFSHKEGYAIMQALIAHRVIGDFRAPDILRFGITPLYVDEDDILRASETLQEIMEGRLWDRDAYKVRALVT
jgi:kynureninase